MQKKGPNEPSEMILTWNVWKRVICAKEKDEIQRHTVLLLHPTLTVNSNSTFQFFSFRPASESEISKIPFNYPYNQSVADRLTTWHWKNKECAVNLTYMFPRVSPDMIP